MRLSSDSYRKTQQIMQREPYVRILWFGAFRVLSFVLSFAASCQVAAGADPDFHVAGLTQTPLHAAVLGGLPEVVKVLLGGGAAPDPTVELPRSNGLLMTCVG
jgi:hypothetical protein